MKFQSQSITILIAEDDQDDCLLIKEAFEENGHGYHLVFVADGIELFQYLRNEAAYVDSTHTPKPDLILLDLNMPRMDGLEALAELKADPYLRSIPVVVLTISSTEQQVLRTYDLGGAGFIIKPVHTDDMVEVFKVLKQYWFEVVELSGSEHVHSFKNTNSDMGA